MKQTTGFRRAIAKQCVVMPGAFNAATARLIERAGFPAVYASGAGLANATAGVPDIGLLSFAEVAQLAGYMVRAVKIPVLLDADTGFGAVSDIPRTIRTLEQAGVAGIHLEDQVFPKRCGHLAGKEIVPIREMTAKLKAAAKARKDKDFLLIARTDARAVEGMEAAIERARAYLAAGADAIFPEALESGKEFQTFADKIDAPLLANLTEFGRSPPLTVRQLKEMGYKMVIFPMTAFRVAMKAEENLFRNLRRRGTQSAWLKRMQTRQELYDLMMYDPMTEWFGNP